MSPILVLVVVAIVVGVVVVSLMDRVVGGSDEARDDGLYDEDLWQNR